PWHPPISSPCTRMHTEDQARHRRKTNCLESESFGKTHALRSRNPHGRYLSGVQKEAGAILTQIFLIPTCRWPTSHVITCLAGPLALIACTGTRPTTVGGA